MPREFRPPTDEQRCTAHVVHGPRAGERCPKYRVKGTNVCMEHGAKPAHVRAAAARRVADEKALELASRMEVVVPRLQTPGEAAQYTLGQVQRRAAQFAQAADQLTSATYLDKAGQERIRAVLAEERRWLDSMVKLLGVAAVAGSAAEPAGPDPVKLFGMLIGLFTDDVSSALADAGVYDQREAVMAALAARGRLRLKVSQGLILEQIRILTEAANA
jgi:hypothetical protein